MNLKVKKRDFKTWGLCFALGVTSFDFCYGGTPGQATVAENGNYENNETGEKKISLECKHENLASVFRKIERISGYYRFQFSYNELKRYKAADNIHGKTVAEAVSMLLNGTPLKFSANKQYITIYRSTDKRHISGLVTDEEGTALAGATIRIPGHDTGTITDINGRFNITIPSGVHHLNISFIGMKGITLTLRHQSSYRITMQETANLLNDVVTTGYQSLSKERATGAYSILKGDELSKRHATRFSSLLDGLVAGAQGTDDGRGGTAYQIRGTGTMEGDRTPLVVVDGFPLMDISSNNAGTNPALSALEKINPQDVESVTILKDAAAASIWGARSANGVIVITTKKGKDKQLNVEVNTQLSVAARQNMNQVLDIASAADMIRYQRMCFDNGWISEEYSGASFDQLTKPVTASELLLYQGLRWNYISEEEMNKRLAALSALDNKQQIRDNFYRVPLLFQTNASLSKATDKYTTYASIRYQHNAGDFIGSRENAMMINWNNTFHVNKHIALIIDLGFQQDNAHRSQISASDLKMLSPYEMLLNSDGSYASNIYSYNTSVLELYDWKQYPYQDMNYNMLQEARTRTERTTNTNYRAQVGLDITLIDGLTLNSKFQYEENSYKRRLYSTAESFYSRFETNYFTPADFEGNVTGVTLLPKGGILQPSDGKRRGVVFRNDLSFDHTFNEVHSLSAVAGSEISNYYASLYSRPYLYGATASNGTGGREIDAGDYETMQGYTDKVPGAKVKDKDFLSRTLNYNRYVSFYGNASYTYDERYGLSLSARSDASNLITSRARYRWSPLWSIGVIWNVQNERFMKHHPFFNRLTFRATYGQNGNSSTASSARTTINTNIASPDDATGIYFGEIADYGNPTLRWEKTATTNIGLDFAILSNHLFGSLDYYNKKGEDILGTVTMSAVNGTTTATYNNASILNRGVEVTLGGNVDIGNVRFTGTLTYAYNKNKITRLYNDLNTVSDILNAEYVEGYPIGAVFAFKYAGVNDKGIPMVYNGIVDKDGKEGTTTIDDDNIWFNGNPNMAKYQGTTVSPHTAGLTLGLDWKSFSLSALFKGRFGGKIRMPSFSYNDLSYFSKATYSGELHDVLNGTNRMLPLPDKNIESYVYTTYWPFFYNNLNINFENASYIYCQEVVLNYTFPQFNKSSKTMKGLGLFCKVENLGLLWSANSRHYNPDYLPGTEEPAITYTIGARINF